MKKDRDFEAFQHYFGEYQRLFGLTGYRVYYRFEPLEDSFAEITVIQNSMVVMASLNSKLSDRDIPFRDVKQSAKHEAIHLLLHRLGSRARERYTSSDEIYEAEEELVFKLEGLITELK